MQHVSDVNNQTPISDVLQQTPNLKWKAQRSRRRCKPSLCPFDGRASEWAASNESEMSTLPLRRQHEMNDALMRIYEDKSFCMLLFCLVHLNVNSDAWFAQKISGKDPYTLRVLKIIQMEITGQRLTWTTTNTVHSVHDLLSSSDKRVHLCEIAVWHTIAAGHMWFHPDWNKTGCSERHLWNLTPFILLSSSLPAIRKHPTQIQ